GPCSPFLGGHVGRTRLSADLAPLTPHRRHHPRDFGSAGSRPCFLQLLWFRLSRGPLYHLEGGLVHVHWSGANTLWHSTTSMPRSLAGSKFKVAHYQTTATVAQHRMSLYAAKL